MILRYILFALGIYLIYKVVFDLVIPVARTTQKIRRQFSDMQQQMHDQMNASQRTYPGQSAPASPKPEQQTSPSGKTGDYIDFEEVK